MVKTLKEEDDWRDVDFTRAIFEFIWRIIKKSIYFDPIF